MATQPSVEVFWSLEVEQGVEKSFERAEGEGLDAGLLGRAEGAAAALELADGDGRGFGLAAFLLTLLLTQPEDLAVGHAAREVVDGDSTHGADLRYGAAAKA